MHSEVASFVHCEERPRGSRETSSKKNAHPKKSNLASQPLTSKLLFLVVKKSIGLQSAFSYSRTQFSQPVSLITRTNANSVFSEVPRDVVCSHSNPQLLIVSTILIMRIRNVPPECFLVVNEGPIFDSLSLL